jgi:hypothetical protein
MLRDLLDHPLLKQARAALDAAQVPSTRDVDDLKRRLGEMEELLDGLAARLARAETRDDTDAPSGKPAKPGSRPGTGGHRSRGT